MPVPRQPRPIAEIYAVRIPHNAQSGDHVLQEEDTVFLVSKSQQIKQVTDFLTRIKRPH